MWFEKLWRTHLENIWSIHFQSCYLQSHFSIVDSLFRVDYCSYGNSVATLHQLHSCFRVQHLPQVTHSRMQEHILDPDFSALHEGYSWNNMYKTYQIWLRQRLYAVHCQIWLRQRLYAVHYQIWLRQRLYAVRCIVTVAAVIVTALLARARFSWETKLIIRGFVLPCISSALHIFSSISFTCWT
jgi:hypothetical protein